MENHEIRSAQKPLRVVYAGDDSWGTNFQLLVDVGVEIVLCLSTDDDNFNQTIRQSCQEKNIPIVTGKPSRQDWQKVNDTSADLLLVAAYDYLVPVNSLESIKTKVNMHASYLPNGKGPDPLPYIVEEMASGNTQAAGVTLHLLEQELDVGDILLQERPDRRLTNEPSLAELTNSALILGPMLLSKFLQDIDGYLATATPQGKGGYWPHRAVDTYTIDPDKDDHNQIVRILRSQEDQGFQILINGKPTEFKSATYSPGQHPFRPGQIIGNLSGSPIIAVKTGVIRCRLS